MSACFCLDSYESGRVDLTAWRNFQIKSTKYSVNPDLSPSYPILHCSHRAHDHRRRLRPGPELDVDVAHDLVVLLVLLLLLLLLLPAEGAALLLLQLLRRRVDLRHHVVVEVALVRLGVNSIGLFRPDKWSQCRPENWPEVPFEKAICINFLLWTFRAALQAFSYYCSSILFSIGHKATPKAARKMARLAHLELHAEPVLVAVGAQALLLLLPLRDFGLQLGHRRVDLLPRLGLLLRLLRIIRLL